MNVQDLHNEPDPEATDDKVRRLGGILKRIVPERRDDSESRLPSPERSF